MFGSRQKGAVAERAVAKLLAGWWSTFEENAQFVKTPLSGGWGGPSLRAGFRASGDLMTTSMTFPFTVEVKRREGWSLDRLKAGRPCTVWRWWWQAQEQAAEMNAEPMLWLKHNREPWIVGVRHALTACFTATAPQPLFGWSDDDPPAHVNQGPASPVFYAEANLLASPPTIWIWAAAAARVNHASAR